MEKCLNTDCDEKNHFYFVVLLPGDLPVNRILIASEALRTKEKMNKEADTIGK